MKPSLWFIALGLWWNANTISHNFIHRPFFRARQWNALFSAYLSLLLGLPQSLWRARHLAHHAWVPPAEVQGTDLYHPAMKCATDGWAPQAGFKANGQFLIESLVILSFWTALLVLAPRFFLATYLPGFALGLCLCQLQGYYEHARGTVSHYGRIYNVLFFNDGYHVEHHLRPGEDWSRLPARKQPNIQASRWPAVLRWLEWLSLASLEDLVLRSKTLQRLVLKQHEQAFRTLLAEMPDLRSIRIIGGGMFPRTALILKRLTPQARLTIVDARAERLEQARSFLQGDIELKHEFYDPREATGPGLDVDLLIIPLAFEGNRKAIYERPPAPRVLVHDWIWRRRGVSSIVSWLLLKRLNLVTR